MDSTKPPTPVAPLSLRERMRRAMVVRNLSPRTIEIYLGAVARFAKHFGRPPDTLGTPEIEAYLLHLRDTLHVSWCRFNQAACALRFFYLHVAERPDLIVRIPFGNYERHLPVVLSVEELLALLAAIDNLRDRVLLTVLYSAGMRLGEVCRLTVADVDSSRMLLRIRQGKGRKDRYVPLSPIALDLLRDWYRRTRSDTTGPDSLFFPNEADPSRPICTSTVQRAVRVAARRAGIAKTVSPRTLRHCFATHLMELGTSTRVIQVLLGHSHVRTTEVYTHVTPAHARSPLDLIPTDPPTRPKP